MIAKMKGATTGMEMTAIHITDAGNVPPAPRKKGSQRLDTTNPLLPKCTATGLCPGCDHHTLDMTCQGIEH